MAKMYFDQSDSKSFQERGRPVLECGAGHLDPPLLGDRGDCNHGKRDGLVDHLGAPHHVERPQLLPPQPHHRRPPHGRPQLCSKVEHFSSIPLVV